MKISLSQPKRNETENSDKSKLRRLKMKNSPKNTPKLAVFNILFVQQHSQSMKREESRQEVLKKKSVCRLKPRKKVNREKWSRRLINFAKF
jgi:hypothetical protein